MGLMVVKYYRVILHVYACEHIYNWSGSSILASFPGRSCLQFLIACSIQKQRGKVWEKESHAWCQVDMRVDVKGAVTDSCNSQTSRWSHLQFLIACSIQKRRGKVWEKESHAWRQVDMRVDVKGAVTDSCNSQTLRWSASSLPNRTIDTVFRMLQSQVLGQNITRRTLRFFVGHRPPHIYSHVYLTSRTWLFLPGLPPPFLHTASDQKLEAGTAWERG